MRPACLSLLVFWACLLTAGCEDETSAGGEKAPRRPSTTRPSTHRALRLVAAVHKTGKKTAEGVAVSAMAESPDGNYLAWGDEYGRVRIYSFARKEMRFVSFPRKKLQVVWDGRHIRVHEKLEQEILDLRFDGQGNLTWFDFSCHLVRAIPRRDGAFKALPVISLPEPGIALCGKLLSNGLVVPQSVRTAGFWSRRATRGLKLTDLKGQALVTSEVLFLKHANVNEVAKHIAVSGDEKLLMVVAFGNAALVQLEGLKIMRRFDRGWGECGAFSPSAKLVALGTYGHGGKWG